MKSTTSFRNSDWAELNQQRRAHSFNLRFTELEMAKLKCLAKENETSVHKLCMDALNELLGREPNTPKATQTSPKDDKNSKVVCPNCKVTLFEIS